MDSNSHAYNTISSAPPKKRAGRTKFRETRHPLFKGVRRRGSGDRWVCELRDPNASRSRIWRGTFPTAEMAARAHDVAAMALRGREACLNFADSAWRLAAPPSSSRKDIQAAAAVAAEMFRPKSAPERGSPSPEESSESETKAAVESSGVLDAMEFERGCCWDVFAESLGFSGVGGYVCEETETVVDISLWSYSL